jgi:hypothetical protein
MRIQGLFCRRFFLAWVAAATTTLYATDSIGQDKAKSELAKSSAAAAKWVTDDESISLVAGDELLFRYVFRSGKKPIVHPLVGPGGKTMAREYPMKPPGEGGTKDHIHQRSMWMTHGEVNDIDFWSEGDGSGSIEHVAVNSSTVDEKGVGTLVTTARWVKPDGTVLLDEHKTFRIGSGDGERTIDMDVTFTAVADEVHFGDTKEGSFGIRVPDSMMVDRKLGGKIINAEGLEDGKAWGQKSRWVDYSGPVDGDTVGITILEHPESFNAPCRWHVRSYGLFAANPFGEFHFTGGKKTDGHRIGKGDKLRLAYRVILHDGPADVAAIEKHWKRFVSAGS